jgi:hypothetical protein
MPRVGLRVALGLVAVSLDLSLAPLGRDLALQALALDLHLGLIRPQLPFGVALPCFSVTALRVVLGIDLRLLQATFTRQIAIAQKRAGGLLRLPGDPASRPPAVAQNFLD